MIRAIICIQGVRYGEGGFRSSITKNLYTFWHFPRCHSLWFVTTFIFLGKFLESESMNFSLNIVRGDHYDRENSWKLTTFFRKINVFKQNVGTKTKKRRFIFGCYYQKFPVNSLQNPPKKQYKIWWISWANCGAPQSHIDFLNVYFLSPRAYILIFGIR